MRESIMVSPFSRNRLFLIGAILASIPAVTASGQAVYVIDDGPTIGAQGEKSVIVPAETDEIAEPAVVKPPVEVIQERYPSGKVKILREVTQDEQGNYVLHGEWKMWDERGTLIASGQYANDRRSGVWIRVHSRKDSALFSKMPYKEYAAPFTSQANFENGQLHGKWIIFDSKQRKISEWEYTHGVRHGVSRWSYAAGHPMQEVIYRDGLIHGQLRIWDANARLTVDETYREGRKFALKVEHDKAGKKRAEGMALYARYVVDTPDDWWNARPVKYKTSGKDVKHGRWIYWYPNGQKQIEGVFENDLRVGEFTWWYANAQKRLVGNYSRGAAHGSWVWWHDNGQKAAQGEYTIGEPSGAWAYWKKDGKLHQRSDFSMATESIAIQPEKKKPKVDRSKPRASNRR